MKRGLFVETHLFFARLSIKQDLFVEKGVQYNKEAAQTGRLC